jgi:hypothetical protein
MSLSRFIRAPADEVFAFFDDPANTLAVNAHAVSFEVVDKQPDGRRTFEVVMRADTREWMQTTVQVVREPTSRLTTRGGTWTSDRKEWVLTVDTDRRFSIEDGGTRVDVTVETRLDHPLRRPLQAFRNWLHRDAARSEFEYQLDLIAARIEGVAEPDRPHPHVPR